jgi:hypothetical protein
MISTQEPVRINATEFDATKDIMYRKPRVNKNGGKSVGIGNSKDRSHLLLNTPRMLTWGVETHTNDSGTASYSMKLQFPKDEYATDETRAFLKNMQDFEKEVCRAAIENSKEWFNKAKLTAAQVEVLFNPMLYWPKDQETGEIKEGAAPTLKVKLDNYDDQFKCEVYDFQGKLLFPNTDDDTVMPGDAIASKSKVACLIKCGGIYFVNGKFGVTWKLDQAVICEAVTRTTRKPGQCLVSVSAADKARVEEDAKNAEEEEEEDANDEAGVAVAEDSDSESAVPEPVKAAAKAEVKQEVEAKKPAATKVVKKVVRRKKTAEE